MGAGLDAVRRMRYGAAAGFRTGRNRLTVEQHGLRSLPERMNSPLEIREVRLRGLARAVSMAGAP